MMNRHLCLTLFFFVTTVLFLPAASQAGGKGFYPDGQTKWEYLFQDGEISEAKWYDEAGKLVSREFYNAGQPEMTEGYRRDGTLEWQGKNIAENHQEITRFDEASKMSARYQTLDGQTDGEYTSYFADGQPKQTVTYSKGVLEGPARTFFASGQVEHEFNYSNGKVDGAYRSYSREGTLLSEYTFSAGQLQ
jgi:antitoxin component YwqK of YwqJK toxin-antitoxin module